MKRRKKSNAGFTLVEIISVLVIVAFLAAMAVPKFIDMSEEAKERVSAAGLAELNAREKQLWIMATMVQDSAVLADDETVDRSLFDSMDFELNSGSSSDWSYDGGSWSAGGVAATLVFKEVESGIWRSPATLEVPARWSFLGGNVLLSGISSVGDVSEAWGGAPNGWNIDDGTLSNNGNNGFMHLAGTESEDCTITLDAILNRGNGYGIMYNSTKTGNGLPDGYCFQFDPGLGNRFVLRNFQNGRESVIASARMTDVFGPDFNINGKHQIAITHVGNTHKISVDGQVVLNLTDSTHSSGSVGLRTWARSDAVFSNVLVTGQ